jgi:hypothetical protein
MTVFNNLKAPNPKGGWFSRLPRRKQALLLALLMLAFSAGTFLLGLHGVHSGETVTVMAGKSDWSDSFFWSAVTFAKEMRDGRYHEHDVRE